MDETETGASDSKKAAQHEDTSSGEQRSKAKVPAIAVGAGLAGLAGGAALARHDGRRKMLGIPVPRRKGDSPVDKLGHKVEELTSEVRDKLK